VFCVTLTDSLDAQACQVELGPLPDGLVRRPRDRRGLPIPFVQALNDDGTPDFTAVDATLAWKAGEERRCGLCGESIGYWVAFIGGPKSVQHRAFLDPPMHPECAHAAVRLCPHMARRNSSRASKTTAAVPAGFVEDKPDEWCVYETREYRCELITSRGQISGYAFKAAPAVRLFRWVYSAEGKLIPAPD
jgi:hypothetical protein